MRQTSYPEYTIGTLSGYPKPLYIGGYPSVSINFFHGLIDDVTIYDRALTDGEIELHYNNGDGWRGSVCCGR